MALPAPCQREGLDGGVRSLASRDTYSSSYSPQYLLYNACRLWVLPCVLSGVLSHRYQGYTILSFMMDFDG